MVGGVAVNFVHPLRVALRLHASPSQSEGEGRSTRLFRASPALCFPVALPLWIPAFAGMTVVAHASPSQSEGEGRSTRLFRASPALCFPVALPLWIPAFAGMTVVAHASPSQSGGEGRSTRLFRACPAGGASPLPFPSGFRLSPE